MRCPYCSKELSDNAKFCSKCGKSIPRCPTCNEVLLVYSKFCKNDGTELPEELIAALPKKNSRDVGNTNQHKKITPTITTNQRFCKSCGKPCSEGKTLCSECEKKGAKSNIPLIIIAVLLALILIVGGILVAIKVFNWNPLGTPDDTSSFIQDSSEGATSQTTENVEDNTDSDSIIEPIPTPVQPSNTTPVEVAPIEEVEPEQNNKSDEYILADSSTRFVDKSELYGLTADKCKIARNEIYARHGRRFKDPDLQKYFDDQKWYNGTIDPDTFDALGDSVFNQFEIANRQLIIDYEKEQGFRE